MNSSSAGRAGLAASEHRRVLGATPLVIGLCCVSLAVLGSAVAWLVVPAGATAPVHWSPDGTVRMGGRGEVLAVFPLVMLLVLGVMEGGWLLAGGSGRDPRRARFLAVLTADLGVALQLALLLLHGLRLGALGGALASWDERGSGLTLVVLSGSLLWSMARVVRVALPNRICRTLRVAGYGSAAAAGLVVADAVADGVLATPARDVMGLVFLGMATLHAVAVAVAVESVPTEHDTS